MLTDCVRLWDSAAGNFREALAIEALVICAQVYKELNSDMATKMKSKKAPVKTAAKKAAPAKVTAKKVAVKAKGSEKKPEKKSAKGPEKKIEQKKILTPEDKKRARATAALEEAMKADGGSDDGDEDEFDPAAFFAASGGKGVFRAHVMRKERVDFELPVRYRFLTGPLVYDAVLLNLSKGGLSLRTPDVIKSKMVLRIEIPLPHTSELFAIQAEVIWSQKAPGETAKTAPTYTGLRFMPMSLAKTAVISAFIQKRRDEVVMAKIGLDRFSSESAPVGSGE